MPPLTRPADLEVGDLWVLPSGAQLLVSCREDDNTCVELGGDVALVVDVSEAAESGIAYLSLHLHDVYYPVGSMPDSNCGTAVWYRDGHLSVIPAPTSEEPVGVPEFTPDDTMFNVVVNSGDLTEWVEFLTALSVDRNGYLSNWTSTGIRLWRGNVDSNGRVRIESVDDSFLRSRDRLDWPRVTRVPDKGFCGPTTGVLPDLTAVGWQSVVATNGGRGTVECLSTTLAIEEAIPLLAETHGPPAELTPHTAMWRSSTSDSSGLTTTTTNAWTVGFGDAPGFDQSQVPPDARTVVAYSSFALPAPPAPKRKKFFLTRCRNPGRSFDE